MIKNVNHLGKRDFFYMWYFLSHILITVFIDSGILIPEDYQLSLQKALVQLHIEVNKDFLLAQLPLWLKIFGIFELTIQLPFFICAPLLLIKRKKSLYPFMVLYGFNASFTTLVCLCHIFLESEQNGLSSWDSWKLSALYMPYLLIPFFIMVDYIIRITKELNFSPSFIKKTI